MQELCFIFSRRAPHKCLLQYSTQKPFSVNIKVFTRKGSCVINANACWQYKKRKFNSHSFSDGNAFGMGCRITSDLVFSFYSSIDLFFFLSIYYSIFLYLSQLENVLLLIFSMSCISSILFFSV